VSLSAPSRAQSGAAGAAVGRRSWVRTLLDVFEGRRVGAAIGASVGMSVGASVGTGMGVLEDASVGALVGPGVGTFSAPPYVFTHNAPSRAYAARSTKQTSAPEGRRKGNQAASGVRRPRRGEDGARSSHFSHSLREDSAHTTCSCNSRQKRNI